MPAHAPSEIASPIVFTKDTPHGSPCIEVGIPGIAMKQAQPAPYTDPTSNAATHIAVGESGGIVYTGEVEVTDWDESNTDVGDAVYIITATNVLTLSSNSGANPPYGRIVRIDGGPTPDRLTISLDLRDTI